MSGDQILARQIIVILSALLYWGGVIINIYRVRKHIGRSPNIRPRGLKERLLWLAWFIVISGWIGQPFVFGSSYQSALFSPVSLFLNPVFFSAGLTLIVSGYACTLWAYTALGYAWRIGINRRERIVLVRQGPYRVMRHPIYFFQMIILTGAACIMPTPFSLFILVLHFIAVLVKMLDEEAFLMQSAGEEFLTYRSQTGMFLPRWKKRRG